jgi:hypothetical protein
MIFLHVILLEGFVSRPFAALTRERRGRGEKLEVKHGTLIKSDNCRFNQTISFMFKIMLFQMLSASNLPLLGALFLARSLRLLENAEDAEISLM